MCVIRINPCKYELFEGMVVFFFGGGSVWRFIVLVFGGLLSFFYLLRNFDHGHF